MKTPFRRLSVVETLTVNDDFTDRTTDLPALLENRRPAFGGAQETKRENVDRKVRLELGQHYGIRQDRHTDAAAGVAVFWDRLLCRPLGEAIDRPAVYGRGWLELTRGESGLLARGVVWQDLVIRLGWVSRARVRVAAAHRPPHRFRHLWPVFDRKLADWCQESPLPVAVFMDANEHGGPTELARLSGLTWRGVGIDGVLTNLKVPGQPVALPRMHSDHRAVAIPAEL